MSDVDGPDGDARRRALDALAPWLPGWPRPTALRRRPTSRRSARSRTRPSLAVGVTAASIALHDAASGRLVFRAAAGPEGGGVVGLSVAANEGIAGYAFSTGQALAIADVAADPRFERATAERTGYVPRSLLAVPLVDDAGVTASWSCSTGATAGRSTSPTWSSRGASRPRRRSWPGPVASITTPSSCCARRSSAWPRTAPGADASARSRSRPCSAATTETGRRRPALAPGRPDRPLARGRSGRRRARDRLARRAPRPAGAPRIPGR